eukprot:jgi/Chrpa1/17699/Chrysochromulina_OHIO_Genome00006151-RA
MVSGAQAVKNRRRSSAKTAEASADKSFFELLAAGPLALIVQFTWPTMRTVWRLRLVCREWTQVIDEQLRQSNTGYYESFPSGSNQKFLYSLISQLATLPYLEEIHIGGYEQGDRNGNDLQVGIELDEAVDLEVHLEILRAFLAQLKKVHTFRGTLGLDDVETILLAAAIKDMPALRHVDFAPSGNFCITSTAYGGWPTSEAIKSLSELRLSALEGIEHDEDLWAHFDPAEQVNLRTFSVGFTFDIEVVLAELDEEKDLPDAVADLVSLIDNESFPSGSNQKFLYSLISQLATLPYLEEIHIGGNELWERHGNGYRPVGIELDEAVDLEVHLEILRAFLAQLKKVHTFRGTLGLDDDEAILLATVIKDMPALRHVDFAPSGSFCKRIRRVLKSSEAMKSLSELRLSTLKGIEHDEYLWAHFDPAEQVNLRTFSVGFTVEYNMDALEGKEDLPDAVADLVSLIDNVRRMPRLEELTLRFFEMAPINVRFWRALRPQLESLVAKVEPRRLHPDSLPAKDDDLHQGRSTPRTIYTQDLFRFEALIRWALGLLAPGLRRVEFEYM